MDIDIDSIVKKMDIKKLIEERIESKIEDYIYVEDIIDSALDDERLKDLIHRRVTDIIDVYLSSDDGKKCVIEKFKEVVADPDIVMDNRVTDIIVEFLRESLVVR
jgi:hypothetical protein